MNEERDKSKDKCANCKQASGFPRGVCWNCDKPICKECDCKFFSDILFGVFPQGTGLRCKRCMENWQKRGMPSDFDEYGKMFY